MAAKYQSNSSDEDVIIELIGNIDESVEFPKGKFRLAQRIIFDCEGIRHLNSLSIQKWMQWFRCFDLRQQFIFKNVPPRIVDQFNMIEDFLPPQATIESFYIPYECVKCGFEERVLARRGKDFIERTESGDARLNFEDELNCPKCKSIMKIATIEAKYFKFLHRPPKSSEPKEQ